MVSLFKVADFLKKQEDIPVLCVHPTDFIDCIPLFSVFLGGSGWVTSGFLTSGGGGGWVTSGGMGDFRWGWVTSGGGVTSGGVT